LLVLVVLGSKSKRRLRQGGNQGEPIPRDGIGRDWRRLFWNTRDWRTFEALRTETAEIKAFIKAFIKVRGGVL
jgi:hypothetical protein